MNLFLNILTAVVLLALAAFLFYGVRETVRSWAHENNTQRSIGVAVLALIVSIMILLCRGLHLTVVLPSPLFIVFFVVLGLFFTTQLVRTVVRDWSSVNNVVRVVDVVGTVLAVGSTGFLIQSAAHAIV